MCNYVKFQESREGILEEESQQLQLSPDSFLALRTGVTSLASQSLHLQWEVITGAMEIRRCFQRSTMHCSQWYYLY